MYSVTKVCFYFFLGFIISSFFVDNTVFSETGEWEKVEIESGRLTKPTARAFHIMAYDSRRGVVVLHGGLSSSISLFSDTWEYDGQTWTRVATDGPRRYIHNMAYDAKRGVVVLFGGRNSPGENSPSETWEWDGLQWEKVNTTVSPSTRIGSGMVYDPLRKVMVLHGGSRNANHDPSYLVYSDTWEFDGQTWKQLPDGPQRWDQEMEFDANKGKIVMFGGYESRGVSPNDTWEFDGNKWEQVAVDGPQGRCAHCMIYDPFRKTMVLYGGFISTGQGSPIDIYLHDMWEWDGEAWHELDVTLKPDGIVFGEMVFDENRKKIVFFGGGQQMGGAMYSDTWEYTATPSGLPKFLWLLH